MHARPVFLITLAAAAMLPLAAAGRNTVMPWMCLERCGYNHSQIEEQVGDLVKHKSLLAAVSFEWADLGPNSTLLVNNSTNVAPALQAAGFSTIAMITTVDLSRMREAFRDPFLFAGRVSTALIANGAIDGVNIDFEPNGEATTDDAAAFADFLFKLRFELSMAGKTVSVDIASWSTVWNFTAISSAMFDASRQLPMGSVISMDTYALTLRDFNAGLDKAMLTVNIDVLVVGLLRWAKNLTQAEVRLRFNAVAKRGLSRVAVWETPLPAFWWPIISDFVEGR